MSIARKTTLIISLTLGLLTLTLFVVLYWQQARSLDALGAAGARDNAVRAQAYLAQQQGDLTALAIDYAVWDDTYDFALSGLDSSDYVAENVKEAFFEQQGVNLFLILDPTGQVIFSRHYLDYHIAVMPSALREALSAGSAQFAAMAAVGQYAGVMAWEPVPLVLAAQPILTSQGAGPSRGFLVVGRYLDQSQLASMNDLLGLDLRLVLLTDPAVPPDVQSELLDQADSGLTVVTRIEPTSLVSYDLLPGVDGQPRLVLTAREPNTSAAQAQAGLGLGALAMLAITAVFGVATHYLLNHLVLARLAELNHGVLQIETDGDLTRRVWAPGRDEITALAEAINRMLASLQKARDERNAAEAKAHSLARLPEESPWPVLRLGGEGQLLYANAPGQGLAEGLAHSLQLLGDEEPVWQPVVKAVLATGQRLEADMAVDDQLFTCLFVPLPEAGYVNLYALNVTEARHATQALEQERDFALQVMNTMGQGLTILDDQGRFEYVNPAAAEMLGCPPDQLLGQTPADLSVGGGAAHPLSEWMSAPDAGKHTFETELKHATGTPVPVLITGVPSRRVGGQAGSIAVITDLSAHRRIEAQTRLQLAALDAAVNGIVITDRQARVLYANPGFTALTGYTVEEVVGQTPRQLKSGQHSRAFYGAMWDMILAGRVWQGEVTNRHKDGHLYIEEMTITPVRAGGGDVTHFVAIKLDVTARHAAENAVRASEAKYRLLIENLSDGVVMTDPAGCVVEWNPVLEATTGLLRADVLGRPLWEVQLALTPAEQQTPALRDGLAAAVEQVLRTGAIASEYDNPPITIHRPDGSHRVIAVDAYPIATPQGVLLCALTHDITERQRMERDLRESEERYRALFEDSPISLWEEDFSAVQQRLAALRASGVTDLSAHLATHPELVAECAQLVRVLDVNRSTLKLYGGQHKAEILAGFAQIIPADTSEALRAVVLAVAEGRTELELETYNWTLAGERLDISLHMSVPPSSQAAYDRVLFSVKDMTAYRQAEAAQRESQAKLAQAVRIKDEFLASMSHELRTPLNTILGMSEVLQEGLYGPVTSNQADSLRSIEESGRHLLALINDILDLSKIEAGGMQLQLDSLPVAEVCQASVRLVKEAMHRKQQRFTLRLDPAVDRLVADERRLKQMLVNLLSNAHKFTPEGGQIELAVTGDAPAGLVRFAVTDTGIGIAGDDQARLFQPFVQIDSRLSRQYAGTGLGLSLVHRMAALHGGTVTLASAPGQGSCFTVNLPWHHPEPVPAADDTADLAAAPLALVAGDGPAPLVLLADDNETNVQMLSGYLEGSAYRLAVARTGHEAVALASSLSPELILMDVQMPEMDGLEATRQIRRQAQHARTPIIALTALAMAGDEERCLAAGTTAYVRKPVSPKALVQLMRALSADAGEA